MNITRLLSQNELVSPE